MIQSITTAEAFVTAAIITGLCLALGITWLLIRTTVGVLERLGYVPEGTRRMFE